MPSAALLSRPRTEPVIDWLLAGDPAIRWQVMRDLGDADEKDVLRERRKVAREGWGARLLAKQDPRGTWAKGQTTDDGLYSPKWTSTTYTLLLLRDCGLPAENRAARKGASVLLDRGLQPDGGINYGIWARWLRRGETCITGMVLSILSHFRIDDDRLDDVANHLLDQQMPDGGWNCRRYAGATHSSVNTTISALEGLWLYGLHRAGGDRRVKAAQRRGREFLLTHRLFRSDRTGEVINPKFAWMVFPPRWHYDILRALDHFQAVKAPRDERLGEAVEIVRGARGADGRWAHLHAYRGKTYFQMERLGGPSRWNTLRALRVLRWWDR